MMLQDRRRLYKKKKKTRNRRSILWRRIGSETSHVVGMLVLLTGLLLWHGQKGSPPQVTSSSTTSDASQRSRLLVEDNQDALDDDFSRDETCRTYIMKFLNGTTDAKDECQGFYNAYQAADCADESHNSDGGGGYLVIDDDSLGRKHRLDNGTVVDDDVVMDDFFEKWECCVTITDFYNQHCQRDSVLDAPKLLGIVVVLVICGLCKSLLRVAGLKWIPDAGACVVVGALVGVVVRLVTDAEGHSDVIAQRWTFDNDLFLGILLPPIIFEAALSIDKAAFRRDLFPILTMAILGTFFSAVAIGLITHHLSGQILPLLDSLLFGALASSIDPVATLGMLSNVGVSQTDTLYTLIFGESLLNDGVSIVLFESLVKHMGDSNVVDHATVADTILHFFLVTTCSMAVGVLCGALCTYYFWALQGKHTAVTEVAMFFTWALIPYYIADGMGGSGIISIMVMGFMLDYFVIGGHQSEQGEWMDYMERRCHPLSSSMVSERSQAVSQQQDDGGDPAPAYYSDHLQQQQLLQGTGQQQPHPMEPYMSRFHECCCKAFSGEGHLMRKSRNHVGFVAKVISSLMETAIFAYLGLFLFNDHRVVDMKLTTTGIFACVSSRAVQVLFFSLLINIGVWLDLEGKIGRCCRSACQRDNNGIIIDDDDSYRDERNYLDAKTQLILFSAGVRGAVSFALVESIPVYDAVTKHGSHFKAELKAMTSAMIVVILFAFGALTYFTVQRDMNSTDSSNQASALRQGLLRRGSVLESDAGLSDREEEDEALSFLVDSPSTPALEIEPHTAAYRRIG